MNDAPMSAVSPRGGDVPRRRRGLLAALLPGILATLVVAGLVPSPAAAVESPGQTISIAGVEETYEVGDVLQAEVVGRDLETDQTWRFLVRPIGSTSGGQVWAGDGDEEEAAQGRLRQLLDLRWDGYEVQARLRQDDQDVAGVETPWVAISVADAGVEPIVGTFPAGPHNVGDVVTFPASRPAAEGETVRLAYRDGGPWADDNGALPTMEGATISWLVSYYSYEGEQYAWLTLRDGVVVAVSEPFWVDLQFREVLVEGFRPIYRVGEALQATAEVFPMAEGLTYRWTYFDDEGEQVVIDEGTDEGTLTLELPIDTLDWDGRTIYLDVLLNAGTEDEILVGWAGESIAVTDAPPGEQLVFISHLAGHYHQGGTIDVELAADPELAEGDVVAWEWLWPGTDWVPLPGVSGLSHQLIAEQALDGVQVRATVDFAADGVASMTTDAETILVDDHGAAPIQQPTVGGETDHSEGGTVTLTRQLPADGESILTDHRWERRAAGSEEWAVVEGELGPELSFAATPDDDGASYRVSILLPSGEVAYGPSPAITLQVGGAGAPSASQTITATLDDADGGGLVVSVDAEDRDVVMSAFELAGDGTMWRSTGELRPITVTDTRSGESGWDASGQVGGFTSGGSGFGSEHLGWTPEVHDQDDDQEVRPGPRVAPGGNPGEGLSVSRLLASAEAGDGRGTETLGADLELHVPTSTAPGTYSATLTITAI